MYLFRSVFGYPSKCRTCSLIFTMAGKWTRLFYQRKTVWLLYDLATIGTLRVWKWMKCCTAWPKRYYCVLVFNHRAEREHVGPAWIWCICFVDLLLHQCFGNKCILVLVYQSFTCLISRVLSGEEFCCHLSCGHHRSARFQQDVRVVWSLHSHVLFQVSP